MLQIIYTLFHTTQQKGSKKMASEITTIQCYGSDLIKKVLEQEKTKAYKIKLLSGNPISSVLTSPLLVTFDDLENCSLKTKVKNGLLIECSKKTLDVIEETEAEYLMIDLLNEVKERYVLSAGTVKAEFSYCGNKDFENVIKKLYPDWTLSTRKCFEIPDNELTQIFTFVCNYFKKRFNQSKIIVVECYLGEEYVDKNKTVKKFPEAMNIPQINAYLKKCYGAIQKAMPQCKFIKFPAGVRSELTAEGTASPKLLDSRYYRYVLKAIDIATNNTNNITLEKLYQDIMAEIKPAAEKNNNA